MIEDNPRSGTTVGSDKNYDTAEFVAGWWASQKCWKHQNEKSTAAALQKRPCSFTAG
jgi:hypothetical protein